MCQDSQSSLFKKHFLTMKVVVLQPNVEKPSLHEIDVEPTMVALSQLVATILGVQRFQPVFDMDFQVSADVYMCYTSTSGLADRNAVNKVATRLLMDKGMLSAPIVSYDIDIFKYAPRGPVVFVHRTMADLTARELKDNWHLFFTNHVPYRELLRRRPDIRSISAYLDFYRKIYYDEKAMQYMHKTYLGGEQMGAGSKERAYQTILCAAIWKALEPFGIETMCYRSVFI